MTFSKVGWRLVTNPTFGDKVGGTSLESLGVKSLFLKLI